MDDVGEMPQQKKKEVETALKLKASLHNIAGSLKKLSSYEKSKNSSSSKPKVSVSTSKTSGRKSSSPKDREKAKLRSLASSISRLSATVSSLNMKREREKYGELAVEESKARRAKTHLRVTNLSLEARYAKSVAETNEVREKIEQSYDDAIRSIDEGIGYIKRYGTGNWYEYNGQKYRGSDLIKVLQSKKKELEAEKQQNLEKLSLHALRNRLLFLGGKLATTKELADVNRHLKKISSLKRSGAYAIRGEGGNLVIYPSKKAYEREQKIEEKIEYLENKPAPEKLAVPFFSYEYWSGQARNLYDLFTGNLSKEKVKERRRKAYRETIVTSSKIWSGKPLESITAFSSTPVGVFSTSLLGGEFAGLGVGALSRVAPTAGTVAKGLLAGSSAFAGGMAAYDVSMTAIKKKDIPLAIGKGIVYGLSFYGAGKLFKGGYARGYEKAHTWWTSKYKPSFKVVTLRKTPYITEGFQELNYRYSVGRNIHETIFFRGSRVGDFNIFATKGKGTLTKGIFRPKTSVFEIPPEISIGKDTLFLSAGRRGISFGTSKTGKPHPAVFFENGIIRYVVSPKYTQRSAWVRGYHVGKGRMILPFEMEGVIYEPKGFTYRGGERPSFLIPIKGEGSGKTIPLYSTEEAVEFVPLRISQIGMKSDTRGAIIPVVSGIGNRYKVSTSFIPSIQTELASISLPSPPSLSSTDAKGTGIALLVNRLRFSPGKYRGLKGLNRTLPDISSMKVGIPPATDIVTKRMQKIDLGLMRRGGRIRIPVNVGKTALRLGLRMKGMSITMPSLKMKGKCILEMGKISIASMPASPPPTPKLNTGIPSSRYTVSLKRKKKRKKSKRRRWKKTLLASPFAVEESYIKFGKATHPKPTRKLWEMGYRTMFKIPTVELMRRKKRRKKRR